MLSAVTVPLMSWHSLQHAKGHGPHIMDEDTVSPQIRVTHRAVRTQEQNGASCSQLGEARKPRKEVALCVDLRTLLSLVQHVTFDETSDLKT